MRVSNRYLIVVNIGEEEQLFKLGVKPPLARTVNKFTGIWQSMDYGLFQEKLPFAVRVYVMSCAESNDRKY